MDLKKSYHMTYSTLRLLLLPKQPSDLKEVVSDMIALCEAIGMTPERCADFVKEQLESGEITELQEKPKRIPAIKKLTALAHNQAMEVANMRKQCVTYVKEKQFGVVMKWGEYFELIKTKNWN